MHRIILSHEFKMHLEINPRFISRNLSLSETLRGTRDMVGVVAILNSRCNKEGICHRQCQSTRRGLTKLYSNKVHTCVSIFNSRSLERSTGYPFDLKSVRTIKMPSGNEAVFT